jgi:2'-5' RNA ligase
MSDDATKAGQRHRFSDAEIIKGLRREMKAYVLGQMSGADDFAGKFTDAMKALGFEDEDGDGEITPDEAAEQAEEAEAPETKGIPAIAADAHPGAMVCLIVPDEMQETLRKIGGNKDAEPDHVTLCYLGPDADAIEDKKNAILRNLSLLAASGPAVEGALGGFARFNASEGSDGMDVLVALVDSPDLPPLHAAICDAICDTGLEPPSDHGFIPHITLAYVEPGTARRAPDVPRDPITFDCLSLVWGGERIDFPFGDKEGEYDDGDADEAAPLALVGGPMKYAIKAIVTDEGDEVLAYPGEGVKAMGEGWVGGYLVRFGGAGDLSQYRDIFTSNTDFGNATKTDVWVHHRMLPGLGKRRLTNQADIGLDDVGVFIKHLLDMRDPYEAALYRAADSRKMGWSSGTAPHLVERKALGDGRHEVVLWPLGLDASYTPTPAGGLDVTTKALKAALDDLGLSGDEQDLPPPDDAARRLALELELLDMDGEG